MIATPATTCSCCRTTAPDGERIDDRSGLPDAAPEGPEEARHEVGGAAPPRADGVRSLIRCRLPIRFAGGTGLVLPGIPEHGRTLFGRAVATDTTDITDQVCLPLFRQLGRSTPEGTR